MLRRLCCVGVLGATLLTSGCGVVAATGRAARPPVATTGSPAAPGATPGAPVDAASLGRRIVAATRDLPGEHFVLRSNGVTASGDLRLDAGRTTAHLTATVNGTRVEMIVIDNRAWVRTPRLTGSRWAAAHSGGTDPMSRLLQSMFDQLAQLQPAQQVRHQVTGPVTRGRTVRIGGVPLTEYVAHPSAQDLLDAMPKQQADQLRTRELTGIAVHVWVDRSYLPRRLTSTVTVSGNRIDTSLELSRFGERVTITAPPASATTSLGSARA